MGVDEDWYLKREGFDEEHHLTALIKNKEKLIVGRIPCQVVDIVCDSQTVSRKHCELFFRNGQWEVYAFKKKTTFINKEPVPPEVLTPLLSNDKLGIGTVMKSRKSDHVFHLYKTVRETSTTTVLPHLSSECTNGSSSSERAVYIQTGKKSIFVHPELLKDPKLSMRPIVSLSKCSIGKQKRNTSRKSSSKKKQPSSSHPPPELNNVENAEINNGPMIWIPMDGLEQLNNSELPPPSSTSTLPKQTGVQSLQDEVTQTVTAIPLPCVKKEKKGKAHLPPKSSDQPGPSNLPNVPPKMIHQPPVVIDIADSDSESEKENSAKQKQERKVFTFEKYSSGQVVVQPPAAQNDHPVVPSSPVTPPPSSVDFNEPSSPESPPLLLADPSLVQATVDSPAKQNDQESSQSSSEDETEETREERLHNVMMKLGNRKCEPKTTKLTEAQSYTRHRGHPHVPLNSGEHEPKRRRRISNEKRSTDNLRENFKKAYHMDGRALAAKAPPTKKAKLVADVVSAPVPSKPHPTKNNTSSVPLPSSSHLAQQAPATVASQSNQSATVPPKPVTVKAKVTSNTRAIQLLNSMNVNDNAQTNKPAAPLAQKRFLEGDGSSRSFAAPPLKKPRVESDNKSKGIPPKVNQGSSPTKKLPPLNIKPDARRTSAETRHPTTSTNGPVPIRNGNCADSRRASTDTRPLTSSTNGPAPAKIGNGVGAKRVSTETNPQTLATPVSIGIDIPTILGYSVNPATSSHPSSLIIPAVRQETIKFPKPNNGSTDPAKFRRSPNKGPGYSRQP